MLELNVEGLTCDHCLRAVKEAVRSVAPQAAVAIDLASGAVRVAGDALPVERVIAAIEEEGYKITRPPARQ